jgi:hypothetical protein
MTAIVKLTLVFCLSGSGLFGAQRWLLDPSQTTAINAHDGNWQSNYCWEENMGGLDQAACSLFRSYGFPEDDSRMRIVKVRSGSAGVIAIATISSLHAFRVVPTFDERLRQTVAWSLHIKEILINNYVGLVVLKSSKYNPQNRVSPDPLLIKSGIIASDNWYHPSQTIGNIFLEYPKPLLHSSGLIHRIPGGFSRVEPSVCASPLAVHRKEDIPYVLKLASIEESSVPTVSVNPQTVSSQDNPGIRPERENRSGIPMSRAEQKGSASPRYIRRSGPASVHWFDPKSETSFEDAQYADYDVSYDGEQWFHLIGEVCYQRCPPIILPSKHP